MTEELSCQELVELVTEYLEGALPPGDVERFETHLAGCRGCRNYLEQMRHTIQVVGHLTEDHVAPEAKETLLATFRGWKRGETPPSPA
ncbi:MAG: zf-HC2 domain-containing protein [Anaerolineae bacterium]|nr:zf-HC2 domain-containing protein [Anaerolineae bacterium]